MTRLSICFFIFSVYTRHMTTRKKKRYAYGYQLNTTPGAAKEILNNEENDLPSAAAIDEALARQYSGAND